MKGFIQVLYRNNPVYININHIVVAQSSSDNLTVITSLLLYNSGINKIFTFSGSIDQFWKVYEEAAS